jgi:hypothetical protein
MAGEQQGGRGRFSSAFGWIERFVNLWSGLSGLGIVSVGGLTAWAAAAANVLSAYAPLSWVVAGIGGALAAALVAALLAFARVKWAQATSVNKWKETVSSVNPLEDTFRNQRIRLADLASPIDRTIRDKTFVDCELIGPANIVALSTRQHGLTMANVAFSNCDFVEIKRQNVFIYNAIKLQDCTLLRGTVHQVTVFAFPITANAIRASIPKLQWLTDEVSTPQTPGASSSASADAGAKAEP